jgi:hypothetical protein
MVAGVWWLCQFWVSEPNMNPEIQERFLIEDFFQQYTFEIMQVGDISVSLQHITMVVLAWTETSEIYCSY